MTTIMFISTSHKIKNNENIFMITKHLFLAVIFIAVFNVSCFAAEFLYISRSQTDHDINVEVKNLEKDHIRVVHRFGRVFFIEYANDVPRVTEKQKIYKISDGPVNPEVVGKDIKDIESIGIKVWNMNYIYPKQPVMKSILDKGLLKHPGPSRVRPKISPPPGVKSKTRPYGASWEDTSEYFLHRVAVGIILMESTGHIEDWTTAERDKFVAEAQGAMEWWNTEAPDANLSFVYEVNYGSTDHEPITEELSVYERTWVQQILTRPPFSYTYADPFVNDIQYDNDLRDRYDTDWDQPSRFSFGVSNPWGSAEAS